MYTISTLNKLISVAFYNSFGIDIRLCCCSWCCCCCCSLMLLLQLGNFMLQFPLPVKRAAFAFYGSNSPGAAITRRVIANWLAPPPCPLWEWREVGEGGGRGWYRKHGGGTGNTLCVLLIFLSFLACLLFLLPARAAEGAMVAPVNGEQCMRVCVCWEQRIQPHHKTERPALFNPLLPSAFLSFV